MKKPIATIKSTFNFSAPAVRGEIEDIGLKVIIDYFYFKTIFKAFIFKICPKNVDKSYRYFLILKAMMKPYSNKLEDFEVKLKVPNLDLDLGPMKKNKRIRKGDKIFYKGYEREPNIHIDQRGVLIIYLEDYLIDFRHEVWEVLYDKE